MNNEPISSPPKPAYTWRQRAVVVVPLALGVVALLVACGGAGSDSDAALASKGDKKTAQAVVPGPWVGRAPQPEYINGILVPPEPAPTINNSTLAGVDSNKDGVRDDVERLIARTYGVNVSIYQEARNLALAEQKLVSGATPQDVLVYTRLVACSINTVRDQNKMTYLLLNTEERRQAYATAIAGATVGSCN